MEDIEDKVGEAKVGVEIAKLNLVEAYLAKIRDVYMGVSFHQKDIFLNNLERIVLALEQNPTPRNVKPRNVKCMPSSYDPIKAKELRKCAGLSAIELGETVLDSKSSYRQIYRYESGEISPRPTNKVGKKYLNWLKEQGYNPFNL